MTVFRLTIKSETAAFREEPNPAGPWLELTRILARLEADLEEGGSGVVKDSNGNPVGVWTWRD